MARSKVGVEKILKKNKPVSKLQAVIIGTYSSWGSAIVAVVVTLTIGPAIVYEMEDLMWVPHVVLYWLIVGTVAGPIGGLLGRIIGCRMFHGRRGAIIMTSLVGIVLPMIITFLLILVPANIRASQSRAALHELTKVGWERYTNKKHGYSFEYPAYFLRGAMHQPCLASPEKANDLVCLSSFDDHNPDEIELSIYYYGADFVGSASYTISCDDSPSNIPSPGVELTDWLKERSSSPGQDIPDVHNLMINGIPAVRLYSTSDGGRTSMETIYFIANNRLFTIRVSYWADVDYATEIFERILATFSVKA